MGYCASLLLGLGMSLTLLRAFLPEQPLWPALILCAAFSLFFHTLFQIPLKKKWLLPLVAAVVLGLWALWGGGPLFTFIQLLKAGFLSFRGIPDAIAPYTDTARWAVCLLFCMLGAALSWDRTVPLAAFTVVTIIALAFVFHPQAELLLCAVPAAAGLLILMAQNGYKRLGVLPVAAALALAAFFLIPGKPQGVHPFSDAAERIRQFVEDYLLFNEYRSSFTLASEGFLPLDDRLGGPADPEDHHVMEVATDRTVLLRGKTYDEYSGLNWYDSLSSRRYLYVSPRFTALRDEIFDLNRPLAGEAPEAETLHVHMLGSGSTTLFAPVRTQTMQLESQRMVLYYNMAGELFLTRNTAPGDSYTVTYLPYVPGSRATAAAVAACAGVEDSHYQEMAQRYLTIPRHIQQEIYDMAQRATAGCETPYEKALGIQRFLRENYRYSLNVQVPPDGVDFLAWFLIGEKQGYCTYFATAMTMLCRIAGIPARYVTGYLAAPDDNGLAVVTGEEAHAWTEVYLNGFGWLDFDATPRTDNNRNADGDSQTPPPNNGAAPSPSPSPSPEPTPSPSPAPAQTPSPEPENNEQGPQDEATPTPPPGAPSPTPDRNPPPDEQKKDPPFPWWLLLLLALAIAVILRFLFTEPLRRAKRHPEQGVQILYVALAGLLAQRGIRREPQETLHDFAARADGVLQNDGLPAVSAAVHMYAAQVYGNHPVDASVFRPLYLAYRKAASPAARLLLALRRFAGRTMG